MKTLLNFICLFTSLSGNYRIIKSFWLILWERLLFSMSNFEKRFGKYAIQNLTLILILCYIVGYLIQFLAPQLYGYITLDPVKVLHGEVWRLVSWLLIPPSSFDLFTIIMLYFYYSIGNLMERTLGTYRFNVYIIGGILLTILASFACMGLCYVFPQVLGADVAGILEGVSAQNRGEAVAKLVQGMSYLYSGSYSTYYINISIFLAFAVCYPEMQVLLMFIIPVKVKWMGVLDLILLGYSLLAGNIFTKFAVGAALLNFLIFYLGIKNIARMRPREVKRRAQFRHEVRQGQAITRHKCAICGRTEQTDENMEFRFCSKCNGNYEYCQEHLFTHEHVK